MIVDCYLNIFLSWKSRNLRKHADNAKNNDFMKNEITNFMLTLANQ